jgi:hypothetical protein
MTLVVLERNKNKQNPKSIERKNNKDLSATNEMETKRTIKRINETKNWLKKKLTNH